MALAEELGAFEPIKQHAFRMHILSTGIGSTLTGDDFSLAIVEGFAPNESSEEIEINADNQKLYYAGRQTYEAGAVSVRDYVDADVANFIKAWRNLVFDPSNGTMGYKSEYAGVALIQQMDPKGVVIREWKLEGIWPQAVDFGQVSQDSIDPVRIALTFRYDKATAQVI